jgi:hypothetical protein
VQQVLLYLLCQLFPDPVIIQGVGRRANFKSVSRDSFAIDHLPFPFPISQLAISFLFGPGKWAMLNGKRSMAMANGQMVNGKWTGERSLAAKREHRLYARRPARG